MEVYLWVKVIFVKKNVSRNVRTDVNQNAMMNAAAAMTAEEADTYF